MKKLLYLIIMILAASSVLANADVNGDNVVDVKDLDVIASNVNLANPDPRTDLNDDGKANVQDMALVVKELS